MNEATIGALSAVVVALIAALANAYRNRNDASKGLTDGYSALVASLQADNAALRVLVADQAVKIAQLEEKFASYRARVMELEHIVERRHLDEPVEEDRRER